MRPAVYKHWNSPTGRNAINTTSSALRAAGASPAPTSPATRLDSVCTRAGQRTGGSEMQRDARSERKRCAQTYEAGGWRLPCVRSPSCYVTRL